MGKRKDSGPIPPGTKAVRLELTDEQQAKLRVMAAEAGLSMAAYARRVVIEAIESTTRGRANRT